MSTVKASLKNKVVIITGASSGIGAATAISFAKCSSRLTLTARNKSRLEEIKQQCLKAGDLKEEDVLLVAADLASAEEVQKITDSTIKHFGTVNCVVNCGGGGFAASLGNVTATQIDQLMRVFVYSPLQIVQAVLPHLMKNKGSVVNVSSRVSVIPVVETYPYSIAKAAQDQLTRLMGLELGRAGVRVNSVNPGWVRTPVMINSGYVKTATEEAAFFNVMDNFHGLGRCGNPDEIGEVVAFLASDAASFITAQNVFADGGLYGQIPSFGISVPQTMQLAQGLVAAMAAQQAAATGTAPAKPDESSRHDPC